MKSTLLALSGAAVLAYLVIMMLPAFVFARGVDAAGVISATTENGIEAEGDASVRASLSGSGVESEVSFTEESNATRAESDASAIVVTRTDLETTESVLTDAGVVITDADFAVYAKGEMRKDENLKRVSASSDVLVVEREREALLFGFIPVTIIVTTVVSADGTVEVKYPWYSFLMSTDEANVEAALADRVSASSLGGASFSATEKARLLAQVESVLSGGAESSSSGAAGIRR